MDKEGERMIETIWYLCYVCARARVFIFLHTGLTAYNGKMGADLFFVSLSGDLKGKKT